MKLPNLSRPVIKNNTGASKTWSGLNPSHKGTCSCDSGPCSATSDNCAEGYTRSCHRHSNGSCGCTCLPD